MGSWAVAVYRNTNVLRRRKCSWKVKTNYKTSKKLKKDEKRNHENILFYLNGICGK